MTDEYSPGPWKYLEDFGYVYDANMEIVAGAWDIPGPQTNCEANSRLIAAAPELLEALGLMIDDHFPDLPLGEQANRLNQADAAIAKATGDGP